MRVSAYKPPLALRASRCQLPLSRADIHGEFRTLRDFFWIRSRSSLSSTTVVVQAQVHATKTERLVAGSQRVLSPFTDR
jgi:hypothetical protein